MLAECTVVVPTIGRPSLDALLDALAAEPGPVDIEHQVTNARLRQAALERDRYMTPEEAKDWGHIDEIVTRREAEPAKA